MGTRLPAVIDPPWGSLYTRMLLSTATSATAKPISTSRRRSCLFIGHPPLECKTPALPGWRRYERPCSPRQYYLDRVQRVCDGSVALSARLPELPKNTCYAILPRLYSGSPASVYDVYWPQ